MKKIKETLITKHDHKKGKTKIIVRLGDVCAEVERGPSYSNSDGSTYHLSARLVTAADRRAKWYHRLQRCVATGMAYID